MGLGIRFRVLLWLVIVSALITQEVAAQTLFRIGSGGVGGTYFPVANLIATAISRLAGCATEAACGESGVLVIAQVSNGSVANVRDLGNRRLEAGLVQADVAYKAYRGQGDFVQDGSYEGLRAIANLYPETMHLVVSASSDIYTVADLAGHRVSLEEPGSGSLLGARFILQSQGLQENDVQAVYVKPQLAAQAMRKGQLDAFFAIAGYPVAAIAELAAAYGIRLVPIQGPEAVALCEVHPYFAVAEIPAGVYSGVSATPTLAVGAQLLVDATLDEQLVYRITRALWSETTRQALLQGHLQGQRIRLGNALNGLAIPLHPGAERYYREVGLLRTDRAQP